MHIVLIIVSLIVAFEGYSMLTQATIGVGYICGACLLAIYARLAQASKHHNGSR
jgi:hypothetical protein